MPEEHIEGHRKGCPTLTEPFHHGCRFGHHGTIERYTAPTYDAFRAQNEQLLAENDANTFTINALRAATERLKAEAKHLAADRRIMHDEIERLRAALQEIEGFKHTCYGGDVCDMLRLFAYNALNPPPRP